MRVHWIQHVDFEGLGNIADWANQHNHQLSCTRQYLNEELPKLADFDLLIVMGGPMGVYDFEKYPWIETEAAFIRDCINENKAILGICLGSQFIAAALGAKVYPGPCKEIGWYPINLVQNSILGNKDEDKMVFHWHGDTFALPPNAKLLASTAEVRNQAYQIGDKVIGLQFHLEQTPTTIETMLSNCAEEIKQSGPKVQTAAEILDKQQYFSSNRKLMYDILDFLTKK